MCFLLAHDGELLGTHVRQSGGYGRGESSGHHGRVRHALGEGDARPDGQNHAGNSSSVSPLPPPRQQRKWKHMRTQQAYSGVPKHRDRSTGRSLAESELASFLKWASAAAGLLHAALRMQGTDGRADGVCIGAAGGTGEGAAGLEGCGCSSLQGGRKQVSRLGAGAAAGATTKDGPLRGVRRLVSTADRTSPTQEPQTPRPDALDIHPCAA